MGSLIKGIAELPKRYAQVLMAKVSALIVLFAILILLTIMLAYVMLNTWHYSGLATFLVCFGPWIVLFFVCIIIAVVKNARLEQDKQDLYELGRQQIIVQGLTLIISWLKRKKTKKTKEPLINDEE